MPSWCSSISSWSEPPTATRIVIRSPPVASGSGVHSTASGNIFTNFLSVPRPGKIALSATQRPCFQTSGVVEL